MGLSLSAAVGRILGGAPGEGSDFFEIKIRPVLVERCHQCHAANSQKVKGDLLLDSREGMLKGGESGKPALVPGDPDKSLLIEAIRYRNDDLLMPPKKEGRLSDGQIADFVAWVKMGAPFPAPAPAPGGAVATAAKPAYDYATARQWWSFQPIKRPSTPAARNRVWPRSALDHFVLVRLEENGLEPAPPADKRTLIRRATFDLTGLPPTPGEVEAFLTDDAPDAFSRVVERLLASPHYGERWGRHWLDVVRYTDSFDARGIGGESDVPEAYRYRDWVVDAFNHDLPFDQFILQQIAGDIMATNDPVRFDPEKIVATGVMAIGEWGTGDADKEKMLTDIVDDQIDVTGRAFLGLTLACARCHDHKFDPIPTEDYYSLAGIFFSSHILPRPGAKTAGSPVLRIPLVPESELERRKERKERMAGLEQEMEKLKDDQMTAQGAVSLKQTARYLLAGWNYQVNSRKESGESAALITQIATRDALRESVLRRWLELMNANERVPLSNTVRDLLGNAGLFAWKKAAGADTPSVTLNASDKEVSFLTIKLPPRSLAVHPGPRSGVAIGWQSPVRGGILIRGGVSDADPNCGDGIEWTLVQRGGRTTHELARGAIPNGEAQAYVNGTGGDKLSRIETEPGEMLELAVFPKAEYSCDTTVIEWEIAELEGRKRVWHLTRDLLSGVIEGGPGNPHGDAYGHPAVWQFYELDTGQTLEAPADSALAKWLELFRGEPGQRSQSEIEFAAAAVQEELLASDPKLTNVLARLTDPRGLFWLPMRGDKSLFGDEARESLARLKNELLDLRSAPLPPIQFAHGLQEGGVPESDHAGIHDVRVHIRGRYDRLGQPVPRRFPRVLAGENMPTVVQGSGRWQLASWIADPHNPLPARVMVNRLWQHHFGHGLVRTPNNFGKLGEPPTHPELLDYLASELIASGGSVKTMQRLIMLSATYQQSSVPPPATLQVDPENKLLGRMSRWRLEAEPLRDSLLAVAGNLDEAMGGPSVRELDNPRRTLYLTTIRSDRSNYRMLFDAADPVGIVEARMDSTVAPQALFLLNNPFSMAQARRLAERMAKEAPTEARRRIEWLYQLLYGRPPGPMETDLGVRAVTAASNSGSSGETAWEQYCQVLLCADEFVYVD